MRFLLIALVAATATLFSLKVPAHEVRPALLSMDQLAPQLFDVSWRVPARGDRRLSLDVQFAEDVRRTRPSRGGFAHGFYTESWTVEHPEGLAGTRVAIDGLERTMTDALVHIRWQDGRQQVLRLLPDRTEFTVDAMAGPGQVAGTYFLLGMEHILLGIDHLLFVLALLLLVNGWKPLVATITAFTLAHSITLATAVLGLVSVPQGPVEAVIALSIVFVAAEVIYRLRGRRTLAVRRPWVVAFGFGLLHGLGFAGALAEIGLPQHAVPLALALFNVGVEAGQLAFVGAVCGLWLAIRQLPVVRARELRTGTAAAVPVATPLAYLVGGLATWWLLERSLALFL
ncbi:HupE/UreJ family protein [Microbulbifer yueqingensis]|uniref:Hydrogenase/urease accessory protein HupE n=1 Tax=Microbulbifer yueqingensis TaxID=658219 RepID=A0A1G8VUQ3_9GAMM|nr:HupE/UreJ family protein [Microbulbifer yueqingensis]SDJ69732.1 Hydrogenase/urease accessory protein HupE [Microbulbifer yueqingensis]